MRPLCLLPLAFAAHAAAQNLVPNGSFEEYTDCPTVDGQMTYATGWVDYLYSPDFWHECGVPGIAGVPYNIFRFQFARTGAGYGGFHAYNSNGDSTNGYREFMGIELLEPLSVGGEYTFTMHASWSTADAGMQGSMRYANNKLGAYLTTQCKLPLFSGRS